MFIFTASVSSSPSSEGVEQQVPEGERQLQLKVSLAGLVVGLCGGDLGEVMSSSITGEPRPDIHSTVEPLIRDSPR